MSYQVAISFSQEAIGPMARDLCGRHTKKEGKDRVDVTEIEIEIGVMMIAEDVKITLGKNNQY